MNFELRKLSIAESGEIRNLIRDAFSAAPWNDDWSDEAQFCAYIVDLVGNPNSLALGLFEDGQMIGVSLGRVRHWYAGTEYCIDDLGIKTEKQGSGAGTEFLRQIETFLRERGIKRITLKTNKNAPAYYFYKKNGFIEAQQDVFFAKEVE